MQGVVVPGQPPGQLPEAAGCATEPPHWLYERHWLVPRCTPVQALLPQFGGVEPGHAWSLFRSAGPFGVKEIASLPQ